MVGGWGNFHHNQWVEGCVREDTLDLLRPELEQKVAQGMAEGGRLDVLEHSLE